MNSLRSLTVNARGLRKRREREKKKKKKKKKKKSVFSVLQKGKYDIVGLHKCHVSSKEEMET